MHVEGAQVTLERLFELAVLLVDGMEGGLSAQGLTRARAELIWRLQRQGPMTQRELSQALQCTPRNVTGLVDALQADGLVTREPHPTDRRATLVHLTERGRAAAADWQSGYQALASLLFADLDAADLSRFAATIDLLLARLRAGAEAGPSAEPGDGERRPPATGRWA
jgi:DNA-binding MarR family transcriptional regulator